MNLEPFLTHDVKNAVFAHLLTDHTREQCGVITLSSGIYRYHRRDNVHEEPDKHFRFDNKTIKAINLDNDIVAYVHTHPQGPNIPSEHDMAVQKAIRKPSVIASIDPHNGSAEIFSFGDHLLDAPLHNRLFRYGVLDCYEAWRAWVWQNEGRRMDQWPRPLGWWDIVGPENPDYYVKNFHTQGYKKFEPDFRRTNSEWHPRVGDVMLMKLGGYDCCNHAAIYIGNNLIYQHRMFRKSQNMPIGYMLDNHYIRHWLRWSAEA